SSRNILELRHQQEFVGRKVELTFFQESLDSSSGEARFRMIISLVGDGGVGKSWLMCQMQQVADSRGVPIAYSDEAQKNLPAVTDHIAGQLERKNMSMKNFRSRYKAYL